MRVKEFSLEEASMLNVVLKRVLAGENCPVRKPILEVTNDLDAILVAADVERNEIIEPHVVKGDDGKAILREGVTNPITIFDYEVTDEDTLRTKLRELAAKIVTVSFPEVPGDTPKLINIDGVYQEVPLGEYLEKATDVNTAVVAMLHEYFIV